MGNTVSKQSQKQNGMIADLRDKGYRVRVFHHRQYQLRDGKLLYSGFKWDDATLLSHGGRTLVRVQAPNGESAIGQARCSDADSYCKKVGVKKALHRALALLNK